METRDTRLFLCVLLLTGLAVGVLGIESMLERRRQERAEDFERLVGGVGFGPTTNLADCPFAFDPRLDDGCAADCGPIPGGTCFCPHHAGSVFYYPPLVPQGRTPP